MPSIQNRNSKGCVNPRKGVSIPELLSTKDQAMILLIFVLCCYVFQVFVAVLASSRRNFFVFISNEDEGPNAESIPLSDILIRTGLSILELLSRKNQMLLVCISFSMWHNQIFAPDLHESSIRRNLIRRDLCEGGLSHADLGVGGEEIALHVSCGVPLHTSCWNSMVPVSC